jgi:hypothetical protein
MCNTMAAMHTSQQQRRPYPTHVYIRVRAVLGADVPRVALLLLEQVLERLAIMVRRPRLIRTNRVPQLGELGPQAALHATSVVSRPGANVQGKANGMRV